MHWETVRDHMIVNQAITPKELNIKLTKTWGNSMSANTIRNNLYGALKTLERKGIITKLGDGLYIRDR